MVRRRSFWESERPDRESCLVLDIRLRGMSGLDFQRKLPESGITIPIIFITGHGDIQMSVRAMKAGAIEFLTKAFRDQDLLDAIHAALENDRESRRRGAEVAELQTSFETLTPWERQVFPLVISGLLNKQIAGQLGISEASEGPPQPAHAQDAGGVLTRFSVDGREIGNPDAEVPRKLTKVKLLLSNAQ